MKREELNIDGKFFDNITGALKTGTNFCCGYVRYPKAGTYKLYSPKTVFGTAYLHIPLFRGDKTFYRSVQCTSNDEKVIIFTLTEDDAKNAPYIGVSKSKPNGISPMLLLDKEYPSNYEYVSPKYDFSDLNGMRWMGACPNDLNNAIDSGWYYKVFDTYANVPNEYTNISAGCLIVMRYAMNDSYSIQLLFDSNIPSKSHIWYRYIKYDGSSAAEWVLLPTRKEINELNSAVVINSMKESSKTQSLSGNYFDWEKADWQDGYDTGYSFNTTSGFKYAFAPLQGPGDYIRVMYRQAFGTTCEKVCLFDKDKNRIKVINATGIGHSDGFTFTLSEEDAKTAAYITMNYQEGIDYHYSGLYYNSSAYPMPVGNDCPLPNYKPSTLPIYKSVFICDGDSIAEGAHDRPKNLSSWWGRIARDYSTTGKNYSVGGGTITSELYYENGSPRHWINASVDSIYSEYPELDYLILEGGTNDADIIGRFSGDTPPQKFGTWADTDYGGNYNNETFCGAVETMFYKALNYWPRAKIGFIIAMQMGRDNNSSANRRRYFDEIKKIAIKWHIPILDLWEESQMDSRLTAYYDSSLTGDEM